MTIARLLFLAMILALASGTLFTRVFSLTDAKRINLGNNTKPIARAPIPIRRAGRVLLRMHHS